MYKRVHIHNPSGVTEDERYKGDECAHLANVKECNFVYHPQYVYNGSVPQLDENDDMTLHITRDTNDNPPPFTTELERLPCLGDDAERGYYTYNPKNEVSYQVQ